MRGPGCGTHVLSALTRHRVLVPEDFLETARRRRMKQARLEIIQTSDELPSGCLEMVWCGGTERNATLVILWMSGQPSKHSIPNLPLPPLPFPQVAAVLEVTQMRSDARRIEPVK